MSAHKHEIAISNLDLGLILAFIIAQIGLGISDAYTALYESLEAPSMEGKVNPSYITNHFACGFSYALARGHAARSLRI